jgi:hypothetical protein
VGRTFFDGMLRHWSHVPSAFDGQIEHFVDNFMKPGNLEGGFAWYRATHAARMALVRDGAPVLPKIEVPICPARRKVTALADVRFAPEAISLSKSILRSGLHPLRVIISAIAADNI